MAKYQIGDLVLAKMKFCPPWPGKIDTDPKGQTKKQQQYVTFFGTNNHAWIQDKFITKYNGKMKPKGPSARAGLNEAITEINAAFELQREAHSDLDEIRKHRQGQHEEGEEADEADDADEANESGEDVKASGEEESVSQKDGSEKRKSKSTPKRSRSSAVASAKRERESSAKASTSGTTSQSNENGASKRRSRRNDAENNSPKQESEPVTAPPSTAAQRSRKRKLDAPQETPKGAKESSSSSSPSHAVPVPVAKHEEEHKRILPQPPRFAFAKQCAIAAQRFLATFNMPSATVRVITDCASHTLPSGWQLFLSALVRKLPQVKLECAFAENAALIASDNATVASLGADWSAMADRVRAVSFAELLKPTPSDEDSLHNLNNELFVLAVERAELFEQLLHRDAAALRALAQRLAGRLVLLLSSTQVHPSVVVELCEALVKSAIDSSGTDQDDSASVKVPCFLELSFVERDRSAQSDSTSASTSTNELDAHDSLALLAGETNVVLSIEKTFRDAAVCKVVNVGPELGSAFYFTLALRALQTAAVVSTAECFAVLEKSSVDRSAYREVLEHSSMRCDTLLHTLDVLASQNFSPASAYLLDAARRDLAMFRQVAHAHSASSAMTTACAELLKRVDARRRDKDGREDLSVVYKAIVQP